MKSRKRTKEEQKKNQGRAEKEPWKGRKRKRTKEEQKKNQRRAERKKRKKRKGKERMDVFNTFATHVGLVCDVTDTHTAGHKRAGSNHGRFLLFFFFPLSHVDFCLTKRSRN